MSWAIKDLITGEYLCGGGRGDRNLNPFFVDNLYSATLYNSKGPATTFINQYKKHIARPHTMTLTAMQNFVPRDMEVVEVEVILREVPK
jgi:hypothetical protein